MMTAARSPGRNSASSSARASGIATSLKSEYVSRVFSRSRSASIRQVSLGQRSSASRSASPRQLYLSRSSMKIYFTTGHRENLVNQFITHFVGGSESGLDSVRERTKVRYALQFVIRQFHMKVIFQPREKIECLQAVN